MSEITTERLSLLIGMIIGQMSELLNNIKSEKMTNEMIYKSLLDIQNAAALHVHELYYKGNKK